MSKEARPDMLKEGYFYRHITSNEVRTALSELQDGEYIPICHSMCAISIGSFTILVDPVTRASLSPKGRFRQLRGSDHLSSDLLPANYPESIFGDESMDMAAATLAPAIDSIFITHLHSDHIDFDFIRKMMEHNPTLRVYGPLGWQAFLGQTHAFEGEPNPKGKPLLPKTIRARLHSLSPIPALGDKPQGLAVASHAVLLDSEREAVISIAFETPHFVSGYAELVQGYLLESKTQHILVLPDMALSPEIINLVQQLHHRKPPLTKIIMSVAKITPDPLLEIPIGKQLSIEIPSIKMSDRYRDSIEEGVSHSIFLPFILAAITDGKIPIELVHFGFYHNGIPDSKKIARRIPFQQGSLEEWYQRVREHLARRTIPKLGMLTFNKDYRRSVVHLISDIGVRLQYSRYFVTWMKENGPPESILKSAGGPISLPLPLTAIC